MPAIAATKRPTPKAGKNLITPPRFLFRYSRMARKIVDSATGS
jgi:hypothetical protein